MWRHLFQLNKKGYIDPGTGGYLLSSLWTWIVGIFTLLIGIITHFFKHKLKNKWIKLSKKSKLIIIIFIVLIILTISLFIYIGNSRYKLPDYDPNFVNVTINTNKAFDGYTLIDGELIDMNGTVVHKWNYGHLGIIDNNGDFYAQQEYESATWGRYSWDGKVIWEKNFPIHHEILLTPEDTIIVLTKKVKKYNERLVEFDVILELNKKGKIIKKWSTWDNLNDLHQYHDKLELDKSPSTIIKEESWKNTSIWGGNYDYYHTNAVSLIPNNTLQNKHPAFNPGNYLISFRHGSMVFIIDKNTGKVVWRAISNQVKDNLEGPHAPQMLKNGNILIYDNGRYRGWTRLVIINPITLDVVWEYKKNNFFSYSQGYAQPLPNNNILITESEKGHIFEIDPNKKIVWEWWHPEMFNDSTKPNYKKRHEIYRATRYNKQFIDEFLK